MESPGGTALGGGYKHHWYSGAADASYENVPLVDANGKELPWSGKRGGRKRDR